MPATWGGKSQFAYTGSVVTGTDITYGNNRLIRVTAAQYQALRTHFAGRTVPVGTSRTVRHPFSVGAWLQAHGIATAVASYVAPILVHEGYAQRVGRSDIHLP